MKLNRFCTLILLSLFVLVYEKTFAQSWQWAKSMGGPDIDAGSSVAIEPLNGSVYSTGHFTGTVDFDPGPGTYNLISAGGEDIFISKLDSSGNFVWAKAIGGYGTDWGHCIAVEPGGSGDIYITGFFIGTVDFDPGQGTFILNAPENYYYECEDYSFPPCPYFPQCDTLCQYFIPGAAMFITKLDGSGNFIWAKGIGGTNSFVEAPSIAVDPGGSGDVYTTGDFTGTIDFDPDSLANFSMTAIGEWDNFICKLNSAGDFRWSKSMGPPGILGGNEGFSIAIDPGGSGDVYTTGYFKGTTDFDPGIGIYNLTSAGCEDIYISKLDSAGTFIWAKAMGGVCNYVTENDQGHSIALDLEGNVYTTGFFSLIADFDPGPGIYNLTSNWLSAMFISKLDAEGNFVWAKAIDGIESGGIGYSIAVDPQSGDVYTTGYFGGIVDFNPGAGTFNLASEGEADIFISILDGSGNFVWAQGIGGTFSDIGEAITVDASGDVYLVGFFTSPSISFDSTSLINHEGLCVDEAGNQYACYYWDIFVAKLDEFVFPCSSMEITSSSDSGSGSLRDIVAESWSCGTITFDVALTDQTINLTSGEILINKNLNLLGLGMLDLTISSHNASRIFHLLPGKNFEIENLALKNATAVTNGGALFVEGYLILENVLLQNNFENGIPKAMTIAPEGMVTIIGNVEIKN